MAKQTMPFVHVVKLLLHSRKINREIVLSFYNRQPKELTGKNAAFFSINSSPRLLYFSNSERRNYFFWCLFAAHAIFLAFLKWENKIFFFSRTKDQG